MSKDVIIALDFDNAKAVYQFLKPFKTPPFVKIGMELFFAEGASMVKSLKNDGHKIFLDLKCHDIPNTVKKAMSVLREMDIEITDLHAAGSCAMMKAAIEGLRDQNGDRKTKLIAITQLTSTDQQTMQKELLIDHTMQDTVAHYAKNAKDSGLDGIVCSPFEASTVKNLCGEDFLTVTPGIRFDDDQKGDQKRIATPTYARQNGSDYIVVGRSITQAKQPFETYQRCLQDFLF